MWATAPLPYYSAYKPGRRKTSTSNKDALPPTSVDNKQPSLLLSTQPIHDSINPDLFEPALDGPPSPERIRALSKQMKRATALDKHKSSATTSSGSSSSLRSQNSDRPSWEHTLDTITLSRRSSGRSTSSNMPNRDRPESVQLFGKTIFNRRVRLRRESSSNQTSAGNSLHSGELALDGPPSTNKDPLIPSIFGRRRTLKQDALGEDSGPGRKLQISGPYNFQHVTHTNRDHLPDLQRGSRAELVTEFSAIRAGQRPTTGSLKGIDVEDLHFSNFSSEALNLQENANVSESQAELSLTRLPAIRHTGPTPAPRRMLKHTRSQEQLNSSPPRPAPQRPPRSPIYEEVVSPTLPRYPLPPSRLSSRASMRNADAEDPAAVERPQTSSALEHPTTLETMMEVAEPPATSHGFESNHVGLEALSDPRFSHAITTPDDAAWPLTASTNLSYEAALPDVPEEEEQLVLARLSRGSLMSTNSSLRGSYSVPVLRQLAHAQENEPERPPSGASYILGSPDILAVQNASKDALEVDNVTDSLHRASWEDDIDYCYEHEVEADCDYAWDRPSLDLVREEVVQTPFNHNLFVAPLSAGLKPTQAAGQLDVPALSPSSQTSTANGHEAITPTITALPVTSNFSHPRKETNYRGNSLLHVRTASYASSFKESHGFNLSPSLLIPGDFRQQMLAEDDMDAFPGDMVRHNLGHFSFDEEPTMTMETPGLFIRDRASTSTTGSHSSGQTSSTEARHQSTNSTWTALTRYTASTTFEGWDPKTDGSDRARSFSTDEFPDLGSPTRARKSTMTPLPEFEEAVSMSHSIAGMRLVSERNPASLSQESLPLAKKEPVKQHRRQRARTTSAVPGQYALFPPIYSGGRI
ncbi:hypothetical protein CCHL11_05487 [Colletotrichum chlorophyti]|uniref:CRIB domain-containing protein n=1 Tax=Colletotrichum chlorophyti TaxID=708187 RepID=A0A1Q8RB03_9PEZI|nr:hypothetical protein CCHL11_05487 [Colletotrichum chlorophyti]